MPWNQYPEMAHVASYTAPDKLEQLRQLCLSPAASMALTPHDRKPPRPSEHPGLPFTSAFPASHNLTLDPGTTWGEEFWPARFQRNTPEDSVRKLPGALRGSTCWRRVNSIKSWPLSPRLNLPCDQMADTHKGLQFWA